MARRVEAALLLASVAIGLLFASPAEAEPDAGAARLFQEGAAAYARGDFRAAALSFEEAYRRAPRGATMYDAGVAWAQAKDWERAADDFETAISDAELDPKHAADARRRLEDAERRVGRIEITAPPGARVTVGPLHAVEPPAHAHLLPGNYPVEVRFASGETTTRTVAVAAGEKTSSAFEPTLSSVPSAMPAPAPPPPPPVLVQAAPPGRAPMSYEKLGWVAVGGTALGAGIATIFGIEALHARDQFFDSHETNASYHDRAATLRTETNIAWGVTAVLAVVGVTLIVLDRVRTPPVKTASAPSML
jgi:hypothetical protein